MKNNDYENISSSSKKGEDLYSYSQSKSSKRTLSVDDGYSLNSYSQKKNKKKLKNRIAILNIFISLLLVFSLISTAALSAYAYYFGDMQQGYLPEDHEELGIDPTIIPDLPEGITNIALFGIDSRSKVTQTSGKAVVGRSDSIIILTVNTNDNTIKLTSILRDSWVPIDGHDHNKINAAYAYGGAPLAVKTLNKLFGLNITDYVSVTLHQLWKVIDYMGGIDIHITEAERKALNGLTNSEGFGVNRLEYSGYVHLDGGQAMTYSRIRKIDGEDFRALRQQKVLNCLFKKAKEMPATKYPGLLKQMLAHVETSLSFDEIISYAPMLAKNPTLMTLSIPGDQVVGKGGVFEDTGKKWVWKYDLDGAKRYLYRWIYNIDLK